MGKYRASIRARAFGASSAYGFEIKNAGFAFANN